MTLTSGVGWPTAPAITVDLLETQTVLWARVRDRIAGPDRPLIVCVDPRETDVARRDVHLAARPGTNQTLMNAKVLRTRCRATNLRFPMVPLEGFEPPTVSLGRNCSSVELQRLTRRAYRQLQVM